MKMTNPEIEVVRFGTEDILTTSGASSHIWDPETKTLTCLSGNNNVGELAHFFVDAVDNETAGVDVTVYFNGEGAFKSNEHGFDRFADGTPAAGQWWYAGADKKYHLCGSGQ